MPYGIPHVNQGQVVLQFKDLFKTLIRRLGRPNTVDAATVTETGQVAFDSDDIKVELDTSWIPRLRATYIRLPAYRRFPSGEQGGVPMQVYRREIRRATGTRVSGAYGGKAFHQGLFGSGSADGNHVATINGLRCSADAGSVVSDSVCRPGAFSIGADDGMYKDVQYTGVQFPQPPSYLFFVYQKDPSIVCSYKNPLACIDRVASAADATRFGAAAARAAFDTHGHALTSARDSVGANGGANMDTFGLQTAFNAQVANRNIAQSQDSNAAILQFELTIQSAVGAFSLRDTEKPYLQDRDRLWRKHINHCHSDYGSAGRQTWQDRECCLLLSSSDYLLGLSTSPGTMFPITLDAKIRYANKAAVADGACFTVGNGVLGRMVFEDFIVGEPVLVGLFDQNILTIAESSAVLSFQAFSQATTAANLQSQ